MTQKITARFIIEIAGKPVENVDKALKLVMDKLKAEEKKFKIVESFVEDPVLDEKTTLYGGFLEVTAKFVGTKEVLDFILDYTPTSIEIEDPAKLKFESIEFTNILNDLSQALLKNSHQLRTSQMHVHILSKKLKELEAKK